MRIGRKSRKRAKKEENNWNNLMAILTCLIMIHPLINRFQEKYDKWLVNLVLLKNEEKQNYKFQQKWITETISKCEWNYRLKTQSSIEMFQIDKCKNRRLKNHDYSPPELSIVTFDSVGELFDLFLVTSGKMVLFCWKRKKSKTRKCPISNLKSIQTLTGKMNFPWWETLVEDIFLCNKIAHKMP